MPSEMRCTQKTLVNLTIMRHSLLKMDDRFVNCFPAFQLIAAPIPSAATAARDLSEHARVTTSSHQKPPRSWMPRPASRPSCQPASGSEWTSNCKDSIDQNRLDWCCRPYRVRTRNEEMVSNTCQYLPSTVSMAPEERWMIQAVIAASQEVECGTWKRCGDVLTNLVQKPGIVTGFASIKKMNERPECPFNCSPLAYKIEEYLLCLDCYLSSECQKTSILGAQESAQWN